MLQPCSPVWRWSVCVCVITMCMTPTVDGLGVVPVRVVEPIRPLLYLHPPAWADQPAVASHRHENTPHTAADDDDDDDDVGELTVQMMVMKVMKVQREVDLLCPLSSARLAHCSDRRPMI